VFDVGITGRHAMFDEYAFYPVRTRVALGSPVTWTNGGKQTHTIEAQDGSWTTGPISPGGSASVVMTKPGPQVFRCREHPWSTAELTVNDVPVSPQAQRGEALYQVNCAACHRENLAGREPAPALAGRLFMSKWNGRAVGDLFELIRTSMPLGRPNALSSQEYLDVVAFLLDTNDIAPGAQELSPGAPRLRDSIGQTLR
jgi:mono/diheme cytochrome c family protein